MRDKKGWQKVDSCRSGSRSKYDKEMDNAFTLIFHNIKRLQDGHLSNSPPSGDTTTRQDKTDKTRQGEMNPPSTLQVPMQRPRASSEPLNRLTEGGIFCQTKKASDTRPKSQSVTDKVSPSLQRRKVTFADDYTAKERQRRRASDFIKRPSSDLQTRRRASDFIKRPSSDLQPPIYCLQLECTETFKDQCRFEVQYWQNGGQSFHMLSSTDKNRQCDDVCRYSYRPDSKIQFSTEPFLTWTYLPLIRNVNSTALCLSGTHCWEEACDI